MRTPARVTHMESEKRLDEPGSEPSEEELEILRLLSEGHTDDAVANRLGLSKRTYSRRLDLLWSKLGARSRFEAGALASQRGWLSASGNEPSDGPNWPPQDEGAPSAPVNQGSTSTQTEGEMK